MAGTSERLRLYEASFSHVRFRRARSGGRGSRRSQDHHVRIEVHVDERIGLDYETLRIGPHEDLSSVDGHRDRAVDLPLDVDLDAVVIDTDASFGHCPSS